MQQQSVWPSVLIIMPRKFMSVVAAVRVVQWLGSEGEVCRKREGRWSSPLCYVQLLTHRSLGLLICSYPTDLFHCSDFWTALLSQVTSTGYTWPVSLEPLLLKIRPFTEIKYFLFDIILKTQNKTWWQKRQLSDAGLLPSFMLPAAKTRS